jgi:hypothetical protein
MGKGNPCQAPRIQQQQGQVMVLVAVALLALIGSAALILLAGSVEWQKNQVQELADSAALDSALKIGISCNAAKANAVITEADNFLATRRTRTGALAITAGTCATPYKGTDTFAGGLSATYNYPYRAHQQQVEVILTLTLPISFGSELGKTSTTLTRRAVAQQLAGSVPAISANNLNCAGGQVNVAGDVMAQNAITRAGTCALYAHTRFDAPSGTYSNLGNISVYADGQAWIGAGGLCSPGLNAGSTRAICADGAELSGHVAPACGTSGTSAFLSPGVALVDPNPCAIGVTRPPVPARSATLPPDPNADPAIFAKLPGGVPCSAAGVYPQIKVKGKVVGTGLGTATLQGGGGPLKYWHVSPSCYGYLDISQFKPDVAILDPGFYYFNGSGFGGALGGGGICLNGAQLYGQDITLEFVNRAGFSSGDCTPGGGGGAAPSQFGSRPCSISVCPPNAPADPAFGTGYTWFAAPCSQAPAGDASCPAASAWCPPGDRACQNLLLYQPGGSTGQIAIISAAANDWMLGSVFWSGTCTYVVNGTSRIDGSLACGNLSISSAAGAGIGVGSDFGVSTALVEALLIE